MCDPVSMLTVAATGAQVGGQIAQGRAASAEANYQAEVEQSNATAEAGVIRRAGRRQRGEALAGMAASGVKIGEGSPLEVEQQLMEDVERDAYMTILTGQRRADAYRREGRAARRSANVGAFGSLLSAGANYAKASGWRSAGAGWEKTQAPAPVENRYPALR